MHKDSSMIKKILIGCSALTLVLGSYTVAQAQTSAPAAPSTEKPAAQPAQPAAPAQPAPAAPSPEELQKFSKIVKQLLVIGKDAEAQITQAIQKEGLTEERFGEIYQAQNNPQAKPSRAITSKERQSYTQALANVRQIQQSADTKLQNVVKQEGLEVQRFNQIFAAIQKDPKLRQEVQKMIGN
jgi:hypothetical protein